MKRSGHVIGLWGWRPVLPEETAQGLLLRIAEIQGHRSIDRTARAAGIARSRLAHGDAIELWRLADEVAQDFVQLSADSPLRDDPGRLCLRGHPIGDLLHFGPRRLCPACLGESWQHRFWWDLRPITTCPRHGIELVDACVCGHKFSWRDGGLVRCSACGNTEISSLPHRAADPRVLRADAYLLSRFGAGQAEVVPVLDVLSVRDVFETLERIAEAFAERFMMMGEIRDRLGGSFPELRTRLRMAGFPPDPDLEKCLCAGYSRSDIEPLLRKVEAGDVTLGKPEGSWKALVREAQKILTAAKTPVPSEGLLAKLRRKMSIGPSDKSDFFYAAMWDARETFVFIEGAGWWLRARPYLGRTLPLQGSAPSQTEIVDQTVLGLLRSADRPLSQGDILASLKLESIATPIADGEVFLRRLAVRHVGEIIKLTGMGYWDRARPYGPALYDPTTWKEKTQTAVQRAGLWIIELLNEAGRPLTRAELEPMLRERGIIPGKCTRAYVGNAVAEFAFEIVYLDQIGYWLAKKPWPPAGYIPPAGKKAA